MSSNHELFKKIERLQAERDRARMLAADFKQLSFKYIKRLDLADDLAIQASRAVGYLKLDEVSLADDLRAALDACNKAKKGDL